jgi:pimeloyl-ACP methyl ester carboxylesterase
MLHNAESGAGSPVVLLHAFPMDSVLWREQRRALASAGYKVLTPDLPGFGGSAVSEAEPSLDAMADEVVALLDERGVDSAVVGGLSMGGYVAMALLRRYPDRIRALILADTKASADTPEAAQNRLTMASKVEELGSAEIAAGLVANLVGATSHAERPDVVQTVVRWIGAQRPAGIAWAQRAMAARPDSHADLERFGKPVLVLYGVEDVVTPAAEAESMAAAARAGGAAVTVRELPRVGHLSAIEDPDAVASVMIEWLQAL